MKKVKKQMVNFFFVTGIACLTFLTACFFNNIYANEKILIASASDLKFAMDEICSAFKKANPAIDTSVSYGSSGNFYAQIKQGAPFDVFFSANASYPELLDEEGFAVKGQRHEYAGGRLVLWVSKNSPLNPKKGLIIVLNPKIKKLAIANPQHAPYGRAAEEALRYYELWDKIQNKLVFGENVSQTAQFVQTGNADAGIIALSLAISPQMANEGKYWILPDESFNKLEQVYTILQRGKDKPGVKAFLDFVRGKQGRKILSRYGFILPKK
ncbi:MAG: molybdate ABC transporter substrate-binding protein [Candidatus Brocadiaceae bacterium]